MFFIIINNSIEYKKIVNHGINDSKQVTATLNDTDAIIFTAQTLLQFLPSPINMITNPPGLSTIIPTNSPLIIDLTDSSTPDVTEFGDDWEWEWEWNCLIPREAGGEGGGECVYRGGEKVELPGRREGRFVGGGEDGEMFEVGVPLLFFVRVRVLERGNLVAEGTWEKVFSVVQEEEVSGAAGLVIEESRWMCQNGAVGYLVCVGFHISLRFKFIHFCFFLGQNLFE